ncbi:MAG TPA: PQQ-binding-like beta-propeller repeat protein [Ktedonobacterales bacterium]|nr:PQQ-binding-like beta-propeller repeat protein [Ktedonobacterales bacterium]
MARAWIWQSGRWRRHGKALALLALLAPLSCALAACGVSLPFVSAAPQQDCVAQQRGALGAGGVIVPLAARDPTSSFHTSALYALRASDGALAWSCASTTYAGWDDVQMVNGVIYAIAGTEPTHGFPPATHAHGLYAIRPQDGKQLWSYSFLAGSTSTLAFDGGLLFVSSVTTDPSGSQSALYAIHTASGALAWKVSFSAALGQPFTVAHRVIVPETSGGDQTLRALREDSGAAAWSKRIGSSAQPASPFTLGGALYLTDPNAATLTAIDGASGATRWTQSIPGTATGQIVAAPGALIAPTGLGVLALDPATGAARWSAALGDEPQLVRVAGQTIYAVSWTSNNTPDRLYALSATNGRQLWSRDVSKLVSLGLLPGAGNQAYLTEPTRSRLLESVVALDQRGGDRWRFDGVSPYNSGIILASGDALYYIWQASPTGDNPTDTTYVTRLRATDGAALWQTPLPALNADPVAPLLA